MTKLIQNLRFAGALVSVAVATLGTFVSHVPVRSLVDTWNTGGEAAEVRVQRPPRWPRHTERDHPIRMALAGAVVVEIAG